MISSDNESIDYLSSDEDITVDDPPVERPEVEEPSDNSTRARMWFYTLNNYTEEDYERHQQLECKWHVCGKEVGESGTPHLQGTIAYKNAKSFQSMKKLLPRAFIAVAKGNSLQCYEYCIKDGDFFEIGTRPKTSKEKGKGEKRRWQEAFNACKEGRFDDVDADIRFRYYNTCKRIRKDFQPPVQSLEDVCGIWIYGPPGTGKSHWARENYPNAYIKAQNKWWDGFDPDRHDSVILDDLDSECLGHYLKIWTDKYAFNAETKGGVIFVRPTKVIITSNFTIEQLFERVQIAQAITRRCEVKHFSIKYRA